MDAGGVRHRGENDPTAAEGYEVLNILSILPFAISILLPVHPAAIIRERGPRTDIGAPYYGWLGVLLKWICG